MFDRGRLIFYRVIEIALYADTAIDRFWQISHEISDESDQRTEISFEVEDFWKTGESYVL